MKTEATINAIVAAVEAADVCCPEQVTDMAIMAAERGQDWQAVIDAAKASDAAERKALCI